LGEGVARQKKREKKFKKKDGAHCPPLKNRGKREGEKKQGKKKKEAPVAGTSPHQRE